MAATGVIKVLEFLECFDCSFSLQDQRGGPINCCLPNLVFQSFSKFFSTSDILRRPQKLG